MVVKALYHCLQPLVAKGNELQLVTTLIMKPTNALT